MYEGNNPIALQSRTWMVNALIALMEERQYQKITIMDICKKADLSRQTFYNIYSEKDDVLRYYFRNLFREEPYNLELRGRLKLSDITDLFSKFLVEQDTLLKLMVKNNLEGIIFEEMSASVSTCTTGATPCNQYATHKYGNAFFTGALTQTLICWFKDPERITSEELSELLYKILTGNYYEICK
ncbi:TetR/AcrR family transcriptional regulator [Anaerocolumna chitinilytica]|uniref:HTH tetR-type domain-containing protein n=1 Tax=Anaerocolumna chitinilytica TaxID=1727145 RepID=A0A7I8DNN0_9FIRM|nr:TetR/AcrR family transcriptional regulator [Anaerocolumna chitinilytica]BCJ98665.1 hypothetical protein bsdcttw_17060 [Anaerocolumna chitinilytica]